MSIPEQTAASPASEQPPAVTKAAPETETETTVAVASPAAEEATSTAADGEPTAVPATEATEETTKKDEAAVEAAPVSEGSLGYKAPGLLK